MIPKAKRIFTSAKPVIGMIHLAALPGAPANELTLARIEKLAVSFTVRPMIAIAATTSGPTRPRRYGVSCMFSSIKP
jgi:hypothetical protein